MKSYLNVYKFIKNNKLKLYHKTQVPDIPLGLCQYKNKLLAGIGKSLCIFDLGKKQLLLKSENKNFPKQINGIKTYKNRIYKSKINNF